MNTLVVIQARHGSTRFPGKIREEIDGISILEHVARRARHHGYATVIAGARGTEKEPDGWAWTYGWRRALGVGLYVGTHDDADVLGRIAGAFERQAEEAMKAGAAAYGAVVRLTADCPFVPVSAIDAVAEAVAGGMFEYAETRSDPSTRPNGIDAQAFTPAILRRAQELSADAAEREHITPLFTDVRQRVTIGELEGLQLDSLPPLRLTVDRPEDLPSLRAIAADGRGAQPPHPTLTELMGLYALHPELFMLELPADDPRAQAILKEAR